ncbi:hypothetical protein MNU23_30845 [Pseudomonas aeruginosa]|uniref:hypothetical protein n=1 Tax=Pseudomonas aeruginosa TaxID=287 RepID=UPI0021A5C613|nr:hypothetical protein [Pseudomonas aeruginosa]MCT2416077.1 hypothetical protein [Pseudomonas aeruginosa]
MAVHPLLKPGGLLATAIPDVHRISHERQFVQLNAGVPAPGMGRHGSVRERAFWTIGTFLDAVARPMVGGTRFLEPPGWDSSAFGTRIIPESQTVAPQGFAELWGQQAINNWLTFAEPAGFQRPSRKNTAGAAQTCGTCASTCPGVRPGQRVEPATLVAWTLVENRNRQVGTSACFAAGRLPADRQQCQADLPGGVAPPQITTQP